MDSGLFRQKSLDKVSSPEQMNDYIRVTSPGVWLVLAAVIALLAGLLIWSVAGRLETTVAAAAVAGPEGTVLYIPEEEMDAIPSGAAVHIDGQDYVLGRAEVRPVAVDGSFDAYTLHVGGLETGQWVYPAAVDADLDEGVYEAKIVVDSVSPISFLLN